MRFSTPACAIHILPSSGLSALASASRETSTRPPAKLLNSPLGTCMTEIEPLATTVSSG
jgi:hypothetical protein